LANHGTTASSNPPGMSSLITNGGQGSSALPVPVWIR
jgi:hypothetical protein